MLYEVITKGYDAGKVGYSIEDVRKQTLWGNLMAGGAGVEYYFGYQLPENDLICDTPTWTQWKGKMPLIYSREA